MAKAATISRHFSRCDGFTYISLIIVVAVIALLTSSTLKLGAVLQRSKAEQELLNIGAAFSDALRSYADATPPGQPSQPPSLKELLKDQRSSGMRRHLRKIFVDPLTGTEQWGLVYVGDKVGVLAVYSLSKTRPVKIGNFPPRFSGFESKNNISDWKFFASTDNKGTPHSVQIPSSSTLFVVGEQQSSLFSPPTAPVSSSSGSFASPAASTPAESPSGKPSNMVQDQVETKRENNE